MLSDGSVAALARAAPPRLAPPPRPHNGQWDLGLGPLGALCQRAQRTSGLSSRSDVPAASKVKRAGLGVSASECLATAQPDSLDSSPLCVDYNDTVLLFFQIMLVKKSLFNFSIVNSFIFKNFIKYRQSSGKFLIKFH